MEIFSKYKESAYLDSLEYELMYEAVGSETYEAALRKFFKGAKLKIAPTLIDKVISEIDRESIDPEITVRLVLSRGDFDKHLYSRRSGVTTKLLFFLRVSGKEEARWFLYAAASGLFASAKHVGLTKEDEVGQSIYISINEYDASISGAAKKAFKWAKG